MNGTMGKSSRCTLKCQPRAVISVWKSSRIRTGRRIARSLGRNGSTAQAPVTGNCAAVGLYVKRQQPDIIQEESMFTDKIELKDFDKMDPEYKELLGHVLTIQADCEIGGPHLYVEKMLPAAPTKLDQLIVARTAAEEIDHYRKVSRVAGDIGVDVSFVLSQPNEKRFVETFRGSITAWEDNAVFGFLIDRVGRYQLEEFYDCSYLPLQRILPDIVNEELGHIEYGYNKTLELIASGDEGKARAQKAVD